MVDGRSAMWTVALIRADDFGTSAERSALSDNVCALMSEDR